MSTTSTAVPTGAARPSRRVQLVVWALFAAALVSGFSLSGYRDAASGPVRPAAVSAAVAAPAGDLTLAGNDSGAGGGGNAPGADSQRLRELYADDPDELLPAYRWRKSIMLPYDFGVTDMVSPGGESAQSMFAVLLFSVASWTWWLLLGIVKFAIGMDLVTSAAGQIDGAFRTAALGLGKTGLPLLAVVAAALMAGMRILRGKLNQSLSLILGAALVVGGLSFFTAATAGTTKTFTADGQTITATSVGSPAYIAQRGNSFINTIVGQLTSGFGATNAMNRDVRNGTFATAGDTDGATCNFYVQQLYATHRNYAKASGGSLGGLEANSLAMVSFMWQRGLYDNYTMAAFGSLGDGSRITCHILEKYRGTQPLEQFAIVGGDGIAGEATFGPYAGMRSGPFFPNPTNDEKDIRAARLAWAACGGGDGQTARDGWKEAGRVTDESCTDWWDWRPSSENVGGGFWDWDRGTANVGINSGDGENILVWDDMSELDSSTSWDGSSDNEAELTEVRTVVRAYYAHNGGQRMMAGLMSLASAGMYAWAFGASALGTIFTQIGLLFFLTLLPYTLLILAFPTKDGGRNKLGVRMLKMTGAMFAGKAVFLALLGVTIQLMSTLYTIVGSFTGTEGTAAATAGGLVLAADGEGSGTYMLWSLAIPAATVLILKKVTQGLGLGNLMSLTGAAGFATSAVMSGKENRKARQGFQGALNGSLVGRTLDRADAGVKKGLRAPGAAARKRLATERNGMKLAKALKNKDITPEQLAQINAGKMTMAQALAATKLANKSDALAPGQRLSPELQRAVAAGHMTMAQAKAVALAQAPAGLGGFAGARERIGALAAGEGDGEPVFSPAGEPADRKELLAAQTERRAQLDIKNKDATPEEWEANMLDEALGRLEELRAGSQGTDVGRTLTLSEVLAEKSRYAELKGIPEELVLLGDSGAPPLIAPVPRDQATGQFIWPEGLSEEAMRTLAANPLNFSGIQKMIGESEAEFHLRAALELDSLALMGSAGNLADVMAEHGVDLGTVAGQEEVVLAVKGESKTLRLEDISFALPDAERRIIETVVSQHYPAAQTADRLLEVGQVAGVSSLSSEAARSAEKLTIQVNQAVTQVLDAAPGSSDQARQMDKALRLIEDRIPAAIADLGAVTLEATVTNDWLDRGDGDHGKVVSAFNEMAVAGEEAIREVTRGLANMVAEVKLADDPSSQAAMLRGLARSVEDVLTSTAQEMSSAVQEMTARADERSSIRQQHLAGQVRPPLRAADFSAGARDIT